MLLSVLIISKVFTLISLWSFRNCFCEWFKNVVIGRNVWWSHYCCLRWSSWFLCYSFWKCILSILLLDYLNVWYENFHSFIQYWFCSSLFIDMLSVIINRIKTKKIIRENFVFMSFIKTFHAYAKYLI